MNKLIDQYGVFGCPVRHSKSPLIHRIFAEQTGQLLHYGAKEVPAADFDAALDKFILLGGKGLNCTVPLKELAWARADQLTERARISKAVNTLKINRDGSISGDNTDGSGLVADLIANNGLTLSGSEILILGAGGASRGIIAPLLEQGPKQLVIANRTVERAQQLSAEFTPLANIKACGFQTLAGQHFDLIINATSASLSNDLPPLPAGLLAENGSCYDLAYAAVATPFVRWGKQQNAIKSLDGLGMLVEQAAEAFFIWRGVRPETESVLKQLNALRK